MVAAAVSCAAIPAAIGAAAAAVGTAAVAAWAAIQVATICTAIRAAAIHAATISIPHHVVSKSAAIAVTTTVASGRSGRPAAVAVTGEAAAAAAKAPGAIPRTVAAASSAVHPGVPVGSPRLGLLDLHLRFPQTASKSKSLSEPISEEDLGFFEELGLKLLQDEEDPTKNRPLTDLLAADGVHLAQGDDLLNRALVLEGDEAEAARAPGRVIQHYLVLGHCAIGAEVLLELICRSFQGNPAGRQILQWSFQGKELALSLSTFCQRGRQPANKDLLRLEAAFGWHALPGHGPFDFHLQSS